MQEPSRSPPRVVSSEEKTLLFPQEITRVLGALCQELVPETNVSTRNAPVGFFLRFFFFLMWTIFKVLIECVTILLLFYVFLHLGLYVR